MTANLEETATYYWLGLNMGLFTVDEVVAWCDEVIARHPDPPLAIIRASVTRDKNRLEVEKELSQMAGEVELGAVRQRIFARMLAMVEEDRNRLFELIYKLDNSYFQDEEPGGSALAREIEYFSLMAYLAGDEGLSRDYREELTPSMAQEFIDFLQQGAQGKTTNYAERATPQMYVPELGAKSRDKKFLKLVFEALTVGGLTAIAIFLMRPRGLAVNGIGWFEFFLVLVIITLYIGVKKWQGEK